jgi:hypothetical protein
MHSARFAPLLPADLPLGTCPVPDRSPTSKPSEDQREFARPAQDLDSEFRGVNHRLPIRRHPRIWRIRDASRRFSKHRWDRTPSWHAATCSTGWQQPQALSDRAQRQQGQPGAAGEALALTFYEPDTSDRVGLRS